ncbi:HAD-IIA family hydrolase [Actinomadura scrupuli]|uniref:HAD-IIA family hydrolase n=1 Tax=Actinomadura scrupuli TaxID=559629 RepID=UPI003D99BA81
MDAVLIDIDGVLTVSWRPLPGAVEAVSRLREAGLGLALLTNTSSRTRASIAATLAEAGFPIGVDDVFTAPALAADYIAERYPGARCLLLNSGDISADLAGVELVEDDPDLVLLCGAGVEFGYRALDEVFGHLQNGARLLALHRNLYWRTDEGLKLDTGAFVAGLEQAAGVTAEVIGKPSAAFFETALAALRADPSAALMVGDDLEADVLAAQRAGLTGVLVRTGKFLPRTLEEADGTPDHVLDSIADVPSLLRLG